MQQQRILIVKRGAMGDILMATPFLRQLRQNFPQAQIDFITSSTFASTLIDNPHLSKIIEFDDKFFSLKHIVTAIKYFFSLRHKYDYVFALDKHYYFNFLISLVGGVKIGYIREKISKLFLNKYVYYDDINRYHGLYYLDLLSALGYNPNYNDLRLDFFIDSQSPQTSDFLVNNKLDNYVVVVNSGGNNSFEQTGLRMLPQDKIIQLLIHLLKTHKALLLGGNIDLAHYANYTKLINSPNLYNLAGSLTLSDSAHILKLATKIYTTDCGAMHLALSQQCQNKMVCFFGPTNPNHVLPPNSGITIYWDDEDIYDPNYALKGTLPQKNINYFTKLNIIDVLKN